MDNAITKQRLMHQLSYDWLKYLGAILAIIIFWVGIFEWRFSVKRNEEIILFTSAYNIKFEESEKMSSYLSSYGIKKVSYTVYPSDEQNYLSILQLKGLGEADLLILSKTDLANLDCARHFIVLDDALINDYAQGQQWEYYQVGDMRYGIMIYQHNNSEYNSKLAFDKWIYFGEGEDYFLLINGLSPNIGDYSTSHKAQSKSTATLDAFGFLLNEYLQ